MQSAPAPGTSTGVSDKISIAMATCNGGKYLREQLDSIYAQTRVPDEVVVCDDCSGDDTVRILEEYRRTRGLRFFANETRLGVNQNFGKAIRNCTGDCIALSDQDDVWLETKVEKLHSRLREIAADGRPSLVTSERMDIDGSGRVLGPPKVRPDNDSFAVTLLGHKMQGCTYMMDRKLAELVVPLPEGREAMFDTYIGLVAAMVGNKYDIGEPLMQYRRHETNVFGRKGGPRTLESSIRQRFTPYLQFYDRGRRQVLDLVQERFAPSFREERAGLFRLVREAAASPSLFVRLHGIFSIGELSPGQKATAALAVALSHLKRRFR